MKKLFQNAKFKVAGGISLLGGVIAIAFYLQKEPMKKPDAGVLVNSDTVLVIHGDSIK